MSDLEAQGCLLVQDGNHGESRPRRTEIVEAGTPHIRAADIDADGVVDFDGSQKINDAALARIRKGVGAPGDVLLTHKGTVGRVGRAPVNAPPFVCSPQTTFWRALDRGVIDPGYLYAYLRSPAFAAQLRTRMHETDMAPYVSLTSQRSLFVSLPPIDEQRRIASVLGALDDRIESNRRLVSFQEELLRASFDRGFSMRPKDVSKRTLDDVAVQVIERIRPDAIAQGARYLPIDEIPRRSLCISSCRPGDEAKSSLISFRRGDILFGAMRPYFHKVAIAPFMGVTRTTVLVLRPRRQEDWSYLAQLMARDETIEFATRTAQGSTIPYATWDSLKKMRVPVSDGSRGRDFRLVATPMLERISSQFFELHTLAAIRDELLPRLVSGRLRVPDTKDPDEVIEPAVEDLHAGPAVEDR